MLSDDPEIRELLERWRESESNFQEVNDELIILLLEKLHNKEYNMMELSALIGVKRTTLYYWLYGREGKNGRQQQQAS